jgi:hypothetical protein
MSIFVNSKVKENTKGYWFGLVIPILVGGGVSLSSMGIYTVIAVPGTTTLIEIFFATIYILGFIAIWPLLAWRLMVRANKLENQSYKNGARMSIRLYILLMAYFLVSLAVSYLLGVV